MDMQFNFSHFTPDDDLRLESDQVLDNLLDLAPYGSIAVAQLSRENEHYRCSIDIYSKNGPFMASIVQPTPQLALRTARKVLQAKLERWQSARWQYLKGEQKVMADSASS